MQLITHSSKNEAITVEQHELIRWRLSGETQVVLKVPLSESDSGFQGVSTCISLGANQLLLAHSGNLEFRDWDSLKVLDRIENIGATAAASSLDCRWLAVANEYEKLLLFDIGTRNVCCEIDLGMCLTSSIAFDPTSTRLAILSTDQGAGALQVHKVEKDQLVLIHADINEPQTTWRFADTFGSIAILDETRLAAYVTSEWGYDCPGWRGEVMLFDYDAGKLLWNRPIDAALLELEPEDIPEEFDYDDMFSSSIVFSPGKPQLIVGSTTGEALVFDRDNGTLICRYFSRSVEPLSNLQLNYDQSTVVALRGSQLIQLPLAAIDAE